MKSEPTRHDVLRAILVDRVETTPPQPRSRRQAAFALGVAFVAGALLAGGTLSATALVGAQTSSNDTLRSAEAGGRSMMGTHDPMVGEPFELVADRDARLDVGTRPDGATALVVAVSCIGAGELALAVDGGGDSYWLTCDDEGGGFGFYADYHEIAVDVTTGRAQYSVWAAWVAKQEVPEPSAQQSAALADGVVTDDEYRAGWDRYAACLLDAGFDIGRSPGNSPGVPVEAADSGVDMTCYVSEFEQLDMAWQLNGG